MTNCSAFQTYHWPPALLDEFFLISWFEITDLDDDNDDDDADDDDDDDDDDSAKQDYDVDIFKDSNGPSFMTGTIESDSEDLLVCSCFTGFHNIDFNSESVCLVWDRFVCSNIALLLLLFVKVNGMSVHSNKHSIGGVALPRSSSDHVGAIQGRGVEGRRSNSHQNLADLQSLCRDQQQQPSAQSMLFAPTYRAPHATSSVRSADSGTRHHHSRRLRQPPPQEPPPHSSCNEPKPTQWLRQRFCHSDSHFSPWHHCCSAP